MTREEAIKYLERADITVGMKVKTKTAEAIEVAIEALKAIDDIKAKFHAKAEMYEDGEYYLSEELIDKIIDKYMKEGDA